MEPIYALALSTTQTSDYVRSALPGAPVVPFERQPQRGRRTRSAIAGGLYRLGDVVAPPTAQVEPA